MDPLQEIDRQYDLLEDTHEDEDILADVNDQLDLFEHSDEKVSVIPSITVQVVLLHPHNGTMVFWVLNKEEPLSASQDFYRTPKPRGWGNPGGGLETEDTINKDEHTLSFEEMIKKCGKREMMDETGFINFDFLRHSSARPEFLEYQYRSGHRVLTLAARLRDFTQSLIKTDHGVEHVKEKEEIERGGWFDLSISPIELFQNEDDVPYWSHIRRTIIVIQRLGMGHNRIHPLWNLAFPIGKGDPRFPRHGYRIPTFAWYAEFKKLIRTRSNHIDLDAIYSQFCQKITEMIRRDEKRFLASHGLEQEPSYAATPEDLRRLAEYNARLKQEETEWQVFGET